MDEGSAVCVCVYRTTGTILPAHVLGGFHVGGVQHPLRLSSASAFSFLPSLFFFCSSLPPFFPSVLHLYFLCLESGAYLLIIAMNLSAGLHRLKYLNYWMETY